MSVEPESPLLRALIAQDQAAADRTPGEFGAFLRWAAARRAQYALERRAWRDANPLIDVKALEDQYGITADILPIEKLKASPVLILGPPDNEGP